MNWIVNQMFGDFVKMTLTWVSTRWLWLEPSHSENKREKSHLMKKATWWKKPLDDRGNDCNLLLHLKTKHVLENFGGGHFSRLPTLWLRACFCPFLKSDIFVSVTFLYKVKPTGHTCLGWKHYKHVASCWNWIRDSLIKVPLRFASAKLIPMVCVCSAHEILGHKKQQQ